MADNTLPEQLKIEQHKSNYQPGVNSVAELF